MSTESEPYYSAGSGLGNVYLVGVSYEIDDAGEQAAEIPCLPKLMEALGKVLVEKKAPLSADEVRFLRKRLRLSSKKFAELVGLSSEQYSRLENAAARVTPTVERVIRVLYAALAQLSPSESHEGATMIWTAELNQQERTVACIDRVELWTIMKAT